MLSAYLLLNEKVTKEIAGWYKGLTSLGIFENKKKARGKEQPVEEIEHILTDELANTSQWNLFNEKKESNGEQPRSEPRE
jgi:hypothetical protein